MFELVYDDLRRIAYHRRLAGLSADSVEAAALVHETYIRFRLRFRTLSAETVQDRRVFVHLASLMMKTVAIDRWRRRRAARRGGGLLQRIPPGGSAARTGQRVGAVELLTLDEALTRLRASRPQLFEVVIQRFFVGRSVEGCARALGIGVSDARRRRRQAVEWLRRALVEGSAPRSGARSP